MRPNTSSAAGSISIERNRFEAVNQPVKALISFAYDIVDLQVIGGPDWINSLRFDIDAKGFPSRQQLLVQQAPEASFAAVQQQMSMVRSMFQQLLADRFQLTIHRETRNLPIYELAIAQGGSKLYPGYRFPPLLKDYPTLKSPPPLVPPRGETWNRFGLLAGSEVGMSNLVAILAQQLQRPVVDKTGLTGLFSFKVMWTPDAVRERSARQGGGPVTVDGVPFDPNGPSLFTALEEELGLGLTAASGPVQVIVIDNVQRPVGN